MARDWIEVDPFEGIAPTADRTELVAAMVRALRARWPDAQVTLHAPGPAGVRDMAAGGLMPATEAAETDRSSTLSEERVRIHGSERRAHMDLLVRRSRPFEEPERIAICFLAERLGSRLRERFLVRHARLINALADLPAERDGVQAVAEGALEAIRTSVAAASATLLVDRGARLYVLADRGEGSESRAEELAAGLPLDDGEAWRAYLADENRIHDAARDAGSIWGGATIAPFRMVLPVGRGSVPRWLAVIAFAADATPPDGDVELLHRVTGALGTALELAAVTEADERLVAMQERLPGLPLTQLYEELLATAVDLVPGADGGALLVREELHEPFLMRASLGMAVKPQDRLPVREDLLRLWYDRDARAKGEAAATAGDAHTDPWAGGVPQVYREQGDRYARMMSRFGVHDSGLESTLKDVRTDMVVPVRVGGSVRAVFLLGSVSRPGAFARDSLRVVRQVAVSAAAHLAIAFDRAAVLMDAATDPLTSTFNRRGGVREAERMLARAQRTGAPFAVALLDLGGFKAINDRFGHAVGDRALQAAAEALKSAVRGGDLVVRWGGDEFLVLLPDQTEADASQTARRLSDAVAAVQVRGRALVGHVGVATYPSDGDAIDPLVLVADRRMYHHKRKDVGTVDRKSEGEPPAP